MTTKKESRSLTNRASTPHSSFDEEEFGSPDLSVNMCDSNSGVISVGRTTMRVVHKEYPVFNLETARRKNKVPYPVFQSLIFGRETQMSGSRSYGHKDSNSQLESFSDARTGISP